MAPSGCSLLEVSRKINIIRNHNCGKCNRIVKNGIQCDRCDLWYRFHKCSKVIDDSKSISLDWECEKCESSCNNGSDETEASASNVNVGDRSYEILVQNLQEELRSLREIINILHEDLKTKNKISDSGELATWSDVVKNRRPKNKTSVACHASALPLRNKFEVLAVSDSSAGEVEDVCSVKAIGGHQHNLGNVLILADSHGKKLSQKLSCLLPDQKVSGFVKPGAKMNSILEDTENLCKDMGVNDTVIIIGGCNDIAKNEGYKAVTSLNRKLNSFQNTNVVVVETPTRHDLPDWSCVNIATRETNKKIRKLCSFYRNTKYVGTGSLDRALFTQHGMHLNYEGKTSLAADIAKVINSPTATKTVNNEAIPLGMAQGNSTGEPI